MSDKQATQEAQLLLNQLLFGKQMTYCLSGVARLGVADHMNATPMAVEEIAGKTGAHAPSLYRVMRMLASMGVFKEEQGKRFALTARGRAAQIRHPGHDALLRHDVRRRMDHARLRTFYRLPAHRSGRREQGLWSACV
jgi:hypothetical protein